MPDLPVFNIILFFTYFFALLVLLIIC